jgi:acyl-coenzyme A synthetase/AMP-(fatty) acid ligase
MMAGRIDRQNLFFGRQAAFCSRTYCDLGLTTALGFQSLLAVLWRGGTLFLTGDPQETVSSLPVFKVQNMIASPSGLLALMQAADDRPEYQCDFQTIFCGGSILNKPLADSVRARLCSELIKGYGSTEATMVASMPVRFSSELPGAVGCILPGIDVEIVDELDRPLPGGTEGTVRIRSEFGAKEYFADPEETQRVFRNGWFYPGDIGQIAPNRILVISGRTKTVINVGGEKINPEKVEEVLAVHPSVKQVAVVAIANDRGLDEVCALIIPRATLIPQVLQSFCQARLPSSFVPTRFVAVSELPRNEMGKIERRKLPDLLKK